MSAARRSPPSLSRRCSRRERDRAITLALKVAQSITQVLQTPKARQRNSATTPGPFLTREFNRPPSLETRVEVFRR